MMFNNLTKFRNVAPLHLNIQEYSNISGIRARCMGHGVSVFAKIPMTDFQI